MSRQDDKESEPEGSRWRRLSQLRRDVAATGTVKEFDWELYEWYLTEHEGMSPETVKARIRHLKFMAGLSSRNRKE